MNHPPTQWLAGLALAMGILTSSAPGSAPRMAGPRTQELSGAQQQTQSAPALYQRLNRILAQEKVSGNLQKAQEELHDLWLHTAPQTPSFQGHEKFLVDLIQARAKNYQRQGDLQAAFDAALAGWPTRQELKMKQDLAGRWDRTAVNLVNRLEKLRNSRDLIRLRKELEDEHKVAKTDGLERIVEEAFQRNQYSTIERIGSPALPSFERLILGGIEEYPAETSRDPLLYYIHMDYERSSRFLLQHLSEGGYLWKLRVINAMGGRDVFAIDEAWSSGSPSTYAYSGWIDLLKVLLSSRETALKVVPQLADLYLREYWPEGLQEAVIQGMESFGSEFVHQVLRALKVKFGPSRKAQPLFEAALRTGDTHARRLAASILAQYESNADLRSHASDPDPLIRLAVANSLLPREVGVFNERGAMVHYGLPKLEQELRMLERLATDSDVRLRERVAEALPQSDLALAPGILQQLARDSSASVRARVAEARSMEDSLRARILMDLAEDSTPEVLAAVDRQLLRIEDDALGMLLLPVLEKRLKMGAFVGHGPAIHALYRTQLGTRALFKHVLSSSEREGLSDLVREYPALEAEESHDGKRNDQILCLGDEALAAVFVEAFEANQRWRSSRTRRVVAGHQPSRFEGFQGVLAAISAEMPPREGLWQRVATDATIPMLARLEATRVLSLAGNPKGAALLKDLALDPHWGLAASEDEHTLLKEAVEAVPAGPRTKLVVELLQSRGMGEFVLASLCETVDLDTDIEVYAREILQRWLEPGVPARSFVFQLLKAVGSKPDLVPRELLVRAVFHPHYAEPAVRALVVRGSEEDLPILARCIRAEWVQSGGMSTARVVRILAIEGIGCFPTDEAVAILLEGRTVAGGASRKECEQQLKQIRMLREESMLWNSERKALPSTDQAVAQLLSMVEDSNAEVRAQAIRGLGSFGRIEALPVLIGLLKDSDPQVVEAARLAVDQLNDLAVAKAAAGSSD